MQQLRSNIRNSIYAPERDITGGVLHHVTLTDVEKKVVYNQSVKFVQLVRNTPLGNIDALMNEYDLSSKENITLMCLAESLLRIPDSATQDALIQDKNINEIDGTGYGLTLGIHSRIDVIIAHISKSVNVGNVYVNRNQIGAVVGVQPFASMGLSGMRSKAGESLYPSRFVTEKNISNNITVTSGNTHLMVEVG